MQFDQTQTARIDEFVNRFQGIEREIAREWINIPNTPDCQPEVFALQHRYGAGALSSITERIAAFQLGLGVRYDTLQSELQTRLLHTVTR